MNKKMLDALNKQINEEFNSAYIYLAMAAHLESENLPGMAAWMKAQYQEEIEHGMKFYGHIIERGGKPILKALDTPKADYSGVKEIFEAALKHERHITKCINDLYDLAVEEKDRPAQIMLQWFIEEQVEEEDNVGGVLDTINMIGEDGRSLYLLDRQLASRGGH